MKKSKSTASRIHKRGFGSMSASEIKAIASMGGKAAHKRGTAHEFSSTQARKAAQKRWKSKRSK